MGLSEPSLITITKPFFSHIVKYHVIVHVVLKYAEMITIAFLISIHTKIVIAMVKNR